MSWSRQRVGTLSSEQRNALEAELLKNLTVQRTAGVQFRDRSTPCPLSYAQESLWFLDRLQPNSPLYNIAQAFRLRGLLDIEALGKSFETLVVRQEALRTRFISVEEAPMQVLQEKPFVLQVLDFSGLSEREKQDQIRKRLDTEARQPFNLAQDLMLRASLLRFSDADHLLTLSIHHIVCDFASLGILYRELSILYEAFRTRSASPLPPLSIQFADFVCAERERFKAGVPPKHLDHWRKTLVGGLPCLTLPTDRARPGSRSFKGSRLPVHISSSLAWKLKEFCRGEGVTPHMALLALFQLLLHRYSSEDSIIVGVPMGERRTTAVEDVIGFFINTLPARTDFSGTRTFRELLQRVRLATLETFSHQEAPFEQVIEELRLPREAGSSPIFQAVFQFLATPSPHPEFSGVDAETLPMETGTAKFDLTLTVGEAADGLTGELEFNTDLFDNATAGRMIGHFLTLLEGAIKDPGKEISALPLLTNAEYDQAVHAWNRTQTDYPREVPIHELFEKEAEANPMAPAVIFNELQLTYRELNEKANQLAHYLRRLGVGQNSFVGICMERSLDLIIGLLGILKAGGAYVPLDANYPVERLAYMVEDAGVSVLLTTSKFEKSFPRPVRVILYDEQRPNISLEASSNPRTGTSAEDLAYVIYTSGSTGKPKGVAIPHRGVVRLVKRTNYMSFGADDIFLQLAPVSFDASTLEIWGALLNGAKLVMFPPLFTSLEQLSQILKQYQVTTLWLTAGLFHQMVEEQLGSLRGLKKLLAGGDVLSVPHVLRILDELPELELINGYGPTENTTFTCCFSTPRSWKRDGPLPIGGPVANTQIYILNKDLQPVPIGVQGELFIGGDGLARGYVNAPELTREKFVPNPFDGRVTRLYKTGDFVRWLPDGNVEFIGRVDQQVKIRGFRVELGEVEKAIVQHPSIREAVVVAEEDKSVSKQLIAYVIPVAMRSIEVGELRSFLASKLPPYMAPSCFVAMEKFPLDANGKIDRRMLAAKKGESAGGRDLAVPRNEAEKVVARIWCEVLRLNQVGIHENFFELGGQSLLAMKVMSRVKSHFFTELPLSIVFEKPTIAEFVTSCLGNVPLRSRAPLSVSPRNSVIHRALLSESEKLEASAESEARVSQPASPGAFRATV